MSITTVRKVATTERLVALTFDDGPHPVFTPRALDIMASYDSREPGLFWVPWRKPPRFDSPNRLRRSRGGAHSYDHVDLTRLSRNQVYSQLSRTKELIVNQAGMFWPYFGPPLWPTMIWYSQ